MVIYCYFIVDIDKKLVIIIIIKIVITKRALISPELGKILLFEMLPQNR